MSEQNAIPLLIVSAAQESVESINSLLRRAGHAVHCTWASGVREMAAALEEIQPQLLIHIGWDETLQPAIGLRDRIRPTLPLIVVSEEALDEGLIAQLMGLGAHDAVSFAHPERLQAVMLRELKAYRTWRAHEVAEKSASSARTQLKTIMEGSTDAIAEVQEGILVEANRVWLELLGVESSVIGEPVMDLFDESSQGTLKAALSAAVQGRWNERSLKVSARGPAGPGAPLEIQLVPGEHEGEPCVRLLIPSGAITRSGERAEEVPAATGGLLSRRELLAELSQRVATPTRALRYLALVEIDPQGSLEQLEDGGDEAVVGEIGGFLQGALQPEEILGRIGERTLLAQLERGSPQEVEAWAQQIAGRLRRYSMRVQDRVVTVTCTMGLVPMAAGSSLDALIGAARERARSAAAPARSTTPPPAPAPQPAPARTASSATPLRREETPKAAPPTPPAQPQPGVMDDRTWVKQLRSALIENRFRLVQAPIASLQGEDPTMFDVLLRLLDPMGREILPAEFMGPAERNDLVKSIDRWVVGASLSFAAQRQPGCLFVRLSRDTVRDASFIAWIDNQLRSGRAQPERICFQISEEIALQHLEQVSALSEAVRERGFRFALEAFGRRQDSADLLEHVQVDFVKIDGGLMQGVVSDAQLLEHVRMLVDAASQRFIQTIGESVEDADTMSVLWQAGMQYVQGNFDARPPEPVRQAERPRA